MDFIDDSPEVSVPLLETWQIAALSERSEVIDAAFDTLAGVFSMSDRDRFVTRLCLDEAITNACEHGCLETAGNVTVSVFAEPPGWVLRVCDQGPGYSAEDIDEGETDPYAEGGRGIPILDGYAERVVVASGGRELTVWLQVGSGEPTR